MWKYLGNSLVSSARKAMSRVSRLDMDPRVKTEVNLFDFATKESLAPWKVFADSERGGLSRGELVNEDATSTSTFRGFYSTSIPEGTVTQMVRSGYVGFRYMEDGTYLDMEDMDALRFRLKGDGRRYIVNIRTEGWIAVPGTGLDIWQAVMPPLSGQWEEFDLPLSEFTLTYGGRIVTEEVTDMNPGRVISLGISLAGGDLLQPEGNFALELDWIKGAKSAP
mmetsp:Transcript_49038/g.157031  ORF Transcript_49038/g.157031 Transcript_49038/m.157031 type:complete len:222 (-) Transcript_49038:41-706(-)